KRGIIRFITRIRVVLRLAIGAKSRPPRAMTTPVSNEPDPVVAVPFDAGGLGGQPRGLTTLFFTEMWERFSYYGMRALLTLFMVTPIAAGGLGFEDKRATMIYGNYVMSVYMLSIPGGFIADNFLGARLSV